MRAIAAAPPTRVETVTDVVHGVEIRDPYRWLEDGDSAQTRAWVEGQNAYTRSVLDAEPGRDRIRTRLAELLSIGVVFAPQARGSRHFYVRRDGAQNQPVIILRQGVDGPERVLVDPNVESDAGLVTLDWWYPSPDGNLLAYGLSSNGDEWSTLHVLDVESGRDLDDRIDRTRYASVGWLPDESGFYYTRFPTPGEVPPGEENYHRKIFFHRLGDEPKQDAYVFGEGLPREHMVSCDISPDGRWLLIEVHRGPGLSDLYLLDRTQKSAEVTPVVVGLDAVFTGRFGAGKLYIHTNLDAPRYRVLRTDLRRPQREHWEEIIPESDDAVLESVTPAGGRLIARYLRKAASSLTVLEGDGAHPRDAALPGMGTVTEVTGSWDEPDAFFAFESFAVAPIVYRLPPDGKAERFAWIESGIDAGDFEVRQDWYRSTDGTPISMFIVRRKGLDLTLPHPTVLTGYGGFNIARTPLFSRTMLLWLERGGVFALPNLRGGSEYGEEWHRAGMLARKQNVFDDFITAAEYLIERGFTDRDRLCGYGRSNGGLLVGAALTQRPDLFKAIVCGVPLLDMVRYHLFLIARLWIPEYGSSEDPAQFEYLLAYSPYHHVVQGESYPAVYFFAAESDSRVDPCHARKMTALLQAAGGPENPILLHTESRAGHGIGKPVAKLVEDETDFWSFVCREISETSG